MANGSYLHVSALTTAAGLVISPNSGAILQRITINTAGATANIMTVYDTTPTIGVGTGSKIIAVINTTNANISTIEYDIVASMGLWYTFLAGTAADITVTYQ